MTPLERAARALIDNYPLDSGESPLTWQEVLSVARAVIEAIRDPSSPMTHAAQSESHVAGDCEGDCEVDYHGIWASMIDALLEEGA